MHVYRFSERVREYLKLLNFFSLTISQLKGGQGQKGHADDRRLLGVDLSR